MKTIILVLLLATCSRAGADQFQITRGHGGASRYVANAEVKIGNPPFAESTDAYGRITVELPKGHYTAVVSVRTEMQGRVSLTIDGNPGLKVVSLEGSGNP